jgi:hypothetical protein
VPCAWRLPSADTALAGAFFLHRTFTVESDDPPTSFERGAAPEDNDEEDQADDDESDDEVDSDEEGEEGEEGAEGGGGAEPKPEGEDARARDSATRGTETSSDKEEG